ncbi:Uncharacterised protein [Mycobacteroides abscessus subsp. abscessus]|nr:Uncharacterised protein [Mycobacteroides abscessus subsp. abscessus]
MLGEVRDEAGQGEDHVLVGGGVLLAQLAVDPGAHAQRGGVHGAGVDQLRAQRGVPGSALGAQVGALVRGAVVVQAEVVRGGHRPHVRPGLRKADAVRGGADDQGDLALEGQQLGALGPLDDAAGTGQGAGGLEEVGGLLGAPSALGGPGLVGHVHRDDLGAFGDGDGGRGGIAGAVVAVAAGVDAHARSCLWMLRWICQDRISSCRSVTRVPFEPHTVYDLAQAADL